MQTEELVELVNSLQENGGDNTHVEAKAAHNDLPKRLWESLSAFANTPGGGVIILGWSEKDQAVVGVTNPQKLQQDLASLCDQMVPPLRPLIQIHKLDGKKIIAAEIPEVSYQAKPCHYQGSGLVSGSYIRVADGDRQLTQYEVQGFLDGRGQPQYDLDPVPASGIDDLSHELLQTFLSALKKNSRIDGWSDEKILLANRVLTKTDSGVVLSLGGLLVLGGNPQKFFPGLTTHVLVYPKEKEAQTGDQAERFIDNIKIEGPILTMVPDIINAIRRNIGKRGIVRGLFREDVSEYPELFFREAITNALVHRDYSPLARGTAVQVKIFPNRIEITNPGGLFGPITEDLLGQTGLQASRNGFLMKLLEDCPAPGEKGALCENRGTGILHMIQALRQAGMEPPRFSDNRTFFRVTCFNNSLFDADTLAWLESYSSEDLSERQRYALAYTRHRGQLTNKSYCLVNDCDSREATSELSRLVQLNILIPHGTGRWTYYTLADGKAKNSPESHVTPKEAEKKDRRADIVKVISSRGEVTRKEIAKELNLQSPTVKYWLRKLVKEKSIEPTGRIKSPRVGYRLPKGRPRK